MHRKCVSPAAGPSFLVDLPLLVASLLVGQEDACLTQLANSEQRELERRKHRLAGSGMVFPGADPGSRFSGTLLICEGGP